MRLLRVVAVVLVGLLVQSPSQGANTVAGHPLGSQQNPVRVDMPGGEKDYLSRLRCQDGKPPHFKRIGSVGVGVYGHILDRYQVTCPNSEPAQSTIFMDMYFPDYHETRAPAGFTITS